MIKLILVFFTFIWVGPIFAQSPTPLGDPIREKVQEKVEAALNHPVAYIGSVTDISESTLQINKYIGVSKENNLIQQVSTQPETSYASTRKNAKAVGLSDIAIGDFIIAMGLVNGNEVLNAKRILVTDPLEVPNRKTILGTITNTTSKTIEISSNNNTYTVSSKDPDKITTITEEKQLNIKFGEINEGDKVLAIGEIEDEVLTIRSLFIVSKAPEE